MSDTIQMRQTGESGDYYVFAAKGDEPVKGLALHTDLTERLDGGAFESGDQYVAVTFDEGGAIELEAEKFTGSTFRVSNQPAVRHAYFTPRFAASYGMDDIPTEETFDVEGFPAVGISDLELSDEDTYDEETNSTADEAADALFGDESESEESEAEESDEEQVEVSDEELGIVD